MGDGDAAQFERNQRPRHEVRRMSDNHLVLKIAGGVVLGLLVWNAFERY